MSESEYVPHSERFAHNIQDKKVNYRDTLPPYTGIINGDSNKSYLPARALLPIPPSMPGSEERYKEFAMFGGTTAEVIVPYKDKAIEEVGGVEEITAEVLEKDPMEELYRHVYMLEKAGDPHKVYHLLPIIMSRIRNESQKFAERNYPGFGAMQKAVVDSFYFLEYACVEKILDEEIHPIDQSIRDQFYADAISMQSRSINYALRIDRFNQLYGEQGILPIADKFKEFITPHITYEEPFNEHIKELIKWSEDDQIWSSAIGSSLANETVQSKREEILRRLSTVWDIYDLARYLQIYTEDNEDFEETYHQINLFMNEELAPYNAVIPNNIAARKELHENPALKTYPYPGQIYDNPNNIYLSARVLLPVAQIDLMRGKPDHKFTMFAGTEHAIGVPFRGVGQWESAKYEIEQLDVGILQNEPMNAFYRHVYMLQHFGTAEQVKEFFPLISQRITNEADSFIEKVGEVQHNAESKDAIINSFYYLKLACLEKLFEAGIPLTQEQVEDLYQEAVVSKPRSIQYAYNFERLLSFESLEDQDYVPVAERVKTKVLSTLTKREHPDVEHAVQLMRWSFNIPNMQTDIMREAFLQASTDEDIEMLIDRFTRSMEVYDVTSFLQEYAATHSDFQPKVETALHYIETNPPESLHVLKGFDKRLLVDKTIMYLDTPVEKAFYTEDVRSAGYLSDKSVAALDKILGIRYKEFDAEDAITELHELTSSRMEHELFRDFYRHLDMLSKFGNAELVAQFIPTIVKRARLGINQHSTVYPQNEFSSIRNGLPENIKELAYLKIMACLEVCEEDPSVRFSKEMVSLLKDAASDNNPRFLRYALVFDDRNKIYGESDARMEQMLVDCGVSYLLSGIDGSSASQIGERSLPWLYVRPELYDQILLQSIQHSYSHLVEEQIPRIVQGLAPFMGVERIRKTLRDYLQVKVSQDGDHMIEKISKVFDYMQFDASDKMSIDLIRDVYEQVDMTGYKPNDALLELDVKRIEYALSGAKNIADIACGTGRHFFAINGTRGRKVTGFDLVPKHIQHIKDIDPEADVHEASWFELPAEDQQFDGIMMLGRSFAHNTTIFDAVACLQEIKRVLKDDGAALIDLPSGHKGDYKSLISETIQRAKEKGIRNILPGTIIDSPDKEHYFDRYIPDGEAFDALCELAGLQIAFIGEHPYQGHGEEANMNVYWKVTKRPKYEHLSLDRVAELIEIIRTDRYTTRQDSPMSDQTMRALSL